MSHLLKFMKNVHFSTTTFIQTCYLNTVTPMKYLEYSTKHMFKRKLHYQNVLKIMGRRK